MKETEQGSQSLVSPRNKLIWILLISLGSITYLAGYYIGSAYQTRNKVLEQCPDYICAYLQYKAGEFDANTNPVIAMEINNLSPANQFIILEGFPLSENKALSDITLQLEVSTLVVDKNQKIIGAPHKKEQATVTYNAPAEGQNYAPQPLVSIPEVNNDNYIFVVRINNMGQLQQAQVNNLRLAFITVNSSYTDHLSYFKWFLFTIALASWFLFRNNLAQIPKGYTSIEQKKVSQLAFLLLLFTQPFACYFAFSSGFLYKLFTVILTATQGSLLISLWFNLLERLAAGGSPVSSTTKFSINFFSAIHLVVYAVVNGIYVKDQEANPLVSFNNDTSQGATLCRYYSYVFVAIVAFWTLLRLLKVIGKIREFDWRDSSALLFSFYYILCYMFFISTGSLQMISGRGARVILLFGITTLYTVLLQVLYASFSHEIEDAEKRKKYDNPDARNQYDDLDMSDMSASKKDDIKLRSNDQMKNKPEDDYGVESEGMEV